MKPATTTTTKQETVAPTYEWQSHPEDYKLIAFGFDDLPCSTGNVQMVVEALAKYEGFGTCFVLGENVEKSGTALLEYVMGYGFEIGNHSYSHARLTELTYNEIRTELQKTNDILKRTLGVTPKWFRPPYLANNANLRAACFATDGMYVMNGNKNGKTKVWYNVEDGGDVLRDAVANAYDGAVYVMHPARSTTALAMEEICKSLYEQGYRFCTMSQLFEYKGITPQYNVSYYDIHG